MSHRLQVLIPPELDSQLEKAAQRSRLSKGEWVRRALRGSTTSSHERNHDVELSATFDKGFDQVSRYGILNRRIDLSLLVPVRKTLHASANRLVID